MHRREPDYSNAKYWFRRLGQHTVYGPLGQAAQQLAMQEPENAPPLFASGIWDSFAFIDLCEAIARGRSSAGSIARQVARIEWQLLFDHCYHQALGR